MNSVSTSRNSVSVVIPTHQPRFLRDTLKGLSAQSDRNFEAIVVENGLKTDGTEALLSEFSDKFQVRYVYEKRLGLNIARNLGCRLARGDILALLDDDCIPEPCWIASIREHYTDSEVKIVGGNVRLLFRSTEPNWMTDEFRALLSEVDYMSSKFENKDDAWIVGANFSFQRSVFESIGGFDEGLGMVGRSQPQLCNDEIEFCQRAEEVLNAKIHFDQNISVDHQVPEDRLRVEYFEQRKFGQGYSDIALILDRGRRPLSEAMEKLERHLYDVNWLARILSDHQGLNERTRSVIVNNSIRIQIEYINGLAAACMEATPDQENIRKTIRRYERRAKIVARRLCKEAFSVDEGLLSLVRFMIDSAIKKPRNYHRCVRPEIMLGRSSFYSSIKRELVSEMP